MNVRTTVSIDICHMNFLQYIYIAIKFDLYKNNLFAW